MNRKAKAKSLGLVLAGMLALTGSALGEGQRGADIHFRGPIFAITRDSNQRVLSLKIEVNQSQVEVQVSSWTEVIAGRGFAGSIQTLELKDFVEVEGFFTSSGKIVAERIHLETPDPLEIEGVIDVVQGNLIRVSGIDFIVDSNSKVHRAGNQTNGGVGFKKGLQVRLRARNELGAWKITEIETGPRSVATEPLRLEGTVTAIQQGLMAVSVGFTDPKPVDAVVLLNAQTDFEGRPVGVGDFVLIEGRFFEENSAALLATRVTVDSNRNGNSYDDNEAGLTPTPPVGYVVEVAGTVRARQAYMNGVHFYINETEIHADSSTRVRVRGMGGTMAAVANGARVEVEGIWASNGNQVYVQASNIEVESEEAEGGDDGSGGESGDDAAGQEVEVEGFIESLQIGEGGSVSGLVVGGETIYIDDNTQIVGESEIVSAGLVVGLKVHVNGIRLDDGSILASQIKVESGEGPGN